MLKKQNKKDGGVKVTFVLPMSDCPGSTSVVGSFNDWDAMSHPLKKRSNGTRSVSVDLAAGDFVEFRYLNDTGDWFNDADAETNEAGNSTISL